MSKKLKWLGTWILIIFAIIVVIAIMGPSTPEDRKGSSQKQESTEVNPYISKGDSKKLGAFSYRVNGDAVSKRKLGGEYFYETAKEESLFLLVPLEIQNVSNRTQGLPLTLDWALKDIDENLEYDISTFSDMYLEEDQIIERSEFLPNEKRGGYLVFKINEGSVNNKLVLIFHAGGLKETQFAVNF